MLKMNIYKALIFHQYATRKKSKWRPKSKMAIEKQVVYSSKQLMAVYILIGELMFKFRILHLLSTEQYQSALKLF